MEEEVMFCETCNTHQKMSFIGDFIYKVELVSVIYSDNKSLEISYLKLYQCKICKMLLKEVIT